MTRWVAGLLVIGAVGAIAYVLLNGGPDAQFTFNGGDFTVPGWQILVASWAAIIAVIALASAIVVDGTGRHVVAPTPAVSGLAGLVVLVAMITTSGITLEFMHIR